ncbi:hypothetical protein EI71_00426 [Anaeroplasma bactoclasticum]|uniref:Uncharacterized protein n=2 Tax=Anaeroplasma bactoclasticum TaxID=2088 RepID=A0A397S757_9MOLU|nr:hypothetical protein EI71_00426 [Anaeroplasma bactoclasticum]
MIMTIDRFYKTIEQYSYKEILLKDDYEYYVRVNEKHRRIHLSGKSKSIESISNGEIKSSECYKVFVIDVGTCYQDLLKKHINGFYRVLIIIQIDENNVKKCIMKYPYCNDNCLEIISEDFELYER